MPRVGNITGEEACMPNDISDMAILGSVAC
jgi:hypothetical protein